MLCEGGGGSHSRSCSQTPLVCTTQTPAEERETQEAGQSGAGRKAGDGEHRMERSRLLTELSNIFPWSAFGETGERAQRRIQQLVPTDLPRPIMHDSNPGLFGFPGAVKIKTPLNRELVATYEVTISVHDNASEVIDRSVSVPNGKHGPLPWRRPGSMGARCLSQPPAQPPGPWPPSPSQAHMRRCEVGAGAPLTQ